MIKEIGQIVSIDNPELGGDATAWVQTQSKTSCSSCQVSSGCGTGIVSKAFGQKVFLTPLKNVLNANINDQVEVGIPEDLVVKASFMVYLLPLICMIICLAVGHFLSPTSAEWVSIISAAMGLCMGFFFVHLYGRKIAQNRQAQPVLLRIVSRPIDVKQIETTS
ncbi:MAG: SoxR reducing system RseC family protein [Kangiellaceae bacterium]|nr:SoxR reducing system RseC family protein [Kangiellaceae bacterium]